MSLNPLPHEELMVTFRNVLHGTSRDWWDVIHVYIHSCADFQIKFLSAFVSEEDEDELAESEDKNSRG